jgi:hypothetical protein
VVAYQDAGTLTPPASLANITIDASALTAGQSLVVRGMDGSGVPAPSAFGGMRGNDVVVGGAGNDRIATGAGNDTLTGGQGNDLLDGGFGVDVAAFMLVGSGAITVSAFNNVVGGFNVLLGNNPYATLVWNAVAANWTVSDLDTTAAGFGVDTLSGVESLAFSGSGGNSLVVVLDDLFAQLRQPISLDDLNPAGTPQAPAKFDASQGAFVFELGVGRSNNTEITGFGVDDAVTIAGLTIEEYLLIDEYLSISNPGADVSLIFNNGGTVSSIALLGAAAELIAIDPEAIVYDVESFNALPVGNIFFLA